MMNEGTAQTMNLNDNSQTNAQIVDEANQPSILLRLMNPLQLLL
jgi:hypothetical protein